MKATVVIFFFNDKATTENYTYVHTLSRPDALPISIFLRYLPAGSFFGEMGVLSGRPRNATVKAAVGAELIKLTGESWRMMLAARPQVRDATGAAVADSGAMNDFIDSRTVSYSSEDDLTDRKSTSLHSSH